MEATTSSNPNPTSSSSSSSTTTPALKSLILDAAPLLTQQPSLTDPILATQYYLPPLVLEELKDERSRQYYQQLKTKGVEILVTEPPVEAMAKVIAFSKKTGDYPVLSPPDLSVLALAYSIEVQAHGTWRIRDEVGGPTGQQKHEAERLRQKKASEASSGPSSQSGEKTSATTSQQSLDSAIESIQSDTHEKKIEGESHPNDQKGSQDPETETEMENEDFQDAPEVDLNNLSLKENHVSQIGSSTSQTQNTQVQINENEERGDDDEEEEIDSEDDEINGGEWITSENLSQHQARSLGLVPAEESSPQEIVGGNPSSSSSSNPHQGSNGTSTSNETTSVQDEIEEGWEIPKSKKSSKSNNNNNKTQTQSQVNQTFGAPTTISSGGGGGGGKSKKKGNKSSKTDIATLTADYAVQNVLLQMGLGLVGAGGMRIKSVRSWVLRCHGCYKICKDSTRKFCPTCGNPTLLRTSVTSRDPSSTKISTGPGALSAASAGVDLHLSKNFIYHNRGTKYSLPQPKAGSSSQRFGTNKVPILREDQSEWIKAVQKEKTRQNKEEKALQKSVDKADKRNKEAMELNGGGDGVGTSSPFGLRYEDPDWMPEMLLGGKSSRNQGGLPQLGIGRKNPNERRRPRK